MHFARQAVGFGSKGSRTGSIPFLAHGCRSQLDAELEEHFVALEIRQVERGRLAHRAAGDTFHAAAANQSCGSLM
jgi:hypothetical protein